MLGVSKLSLLLLLTLMVGCGSGADYEKKVAPDFELTDEKAVTLTRAALAENGFDIEKMTPVIFSNDSNNFFARNKNNPDEGYVLWHKVGMQTSYEHMVTIGYKEGTVRCRIKAVK